MSKLSQEDQYEARYGTREVTVDSTARGIHDLRRRVHFPYGVIESNKITTKRESMKRVFVIEDDKDIVELVRYNLEKEDFQVTSSADGATGLHKCANLRPTCWCWI